MRYFITILFFFASLVINGQDIEYLTFSVKTKKMKGVNYAVNKKYKIYTDMQMDSIFIKRKLVYVTSPDSITKYQVAFKKFLMISVFDSSKRNISVGLEYWNKRICYLISMKEPEMIYMVDFKGMYDTFEIISIDITSKNVFVRKRKENNMVKLLMIPFTNRYW